MLAPASASNSPISLPMSNRRKIWGERRGLNPRPSVPQTDALPAELRSPRTKYTQFSPHSVFSKAGLASLAKLGQIGFIYTNLLGALTIFAPLVIRSQFVLGNRVAKSLDPNAIFEFQEDEECW